MKRLRILTVLSVVLVLASACSAETVVEGWRSPTGMFKTPIYTSVNPGDGSCWVTDQGDGPNTGEVVHLAEDGTELWRGGGFYEPKQVSVNPTDGSCWVADYWNHQIVHLAEDGTELLRLGGFYRPFGVAVDPVDGSCWVANTESSQIVHLAEDGTELLRLGGFNRPYGVAVNPLDGSCWVADRYQYQIVHLAPDGTELWRGGSFNEPTDLSYNHIDDSVWFTTYHSDVFHMASDGTVLNTVSAFRSWGISVNPTDGSCWVSNHGGAGAGTEVIHTSADGTELWQGGGFSGPRGVSVNPNDGSCWLADMYNGQVVHLYTNPPAKDASKVLFTACSHGEPYGPGLFVADGDFSNPVRLTSALYGEAFLPECYCPGCDIGSWSPDGTKVALSRNGKLAMLDLAALMYHPAQTPEWLLDEFGEEITGWSPSWAPDGQRLTCAGGWGDVPGIYVLSADGTGKHLVVELSEASGGDPQWSPDGSRIAFHQGTAPHEHVSLWVVEDIDDPGGPTLRRLTNDPAYSDDGPMWSPDGTRVVFMRGPWGSRQGGPGADLWMVDVLTGVDYQLTDTPDIREGPIGWSSLDGRIYFTEWHSGVPPSDLGYEAPHGMVAISRILPGGSGYEVLVEEPELQPWGATWLPTGVWIGGLEALPGETIAPRIEIVDAESLAGVQAEVAYTGCCNTLSMYGVDLGESILDWVMPAPSIGANTACFLAYAPDPGLDSVSGTAHLFDLGVTNDPAASPGDIQLLTFDGLELSDDWGDPLDRIALAGGVRTIPFAQLEVSEVIGPVCADDECPVPFPLTVVARDRHGEVMADCNMSIDLLGFAGWDPWPLYLLPVVSPTTIALVNGAWSGEVTVADPLPELNLVARWEDIGAYSNQLPTVAKGDVNWDVAVSVFDVIKTANMAIGRGDWEPWQWWAADINCDDEVNVFDVIMCANEALAQMGTMAMGRAAQAPSPAQSVLVTSRTESTSTRTSMTVELSGCAGLAGIQVELGYDGKKLAYRGVSAGELLTGASSWAVMDNDLGSTVKALAYSPNLELLRGGDGAILRFTFDKLGKKSGRVKLASVKLAAGDGAEVPCEVRKGKGRRKSK